MAIIGGAIRPSWAGKDSALGEAHWTTVGVIHRHAVPQARATVPSGSRASTWFMPELNPYLHAKRDAQKRLKRAFDRVVDLRKTYATAALIYTLGGTGIAGVAAALNFSAFAIAAVAVVGTALVIHAIYSTNTIKKQDAEARWTYVGIKRVQLREIEARIAINTVTLALMGERHATGRLRNAPPELRAALAYHQHRLRLAEERAEAAEAVKDGRATDAQRRMLLRHQRGRQPAPPKGPAVEPIKRRRDALEAERAELEAEIKSLSTADDIVQAMEADEVTGARRTRRERQDAARKADQAARDRVRAGKPPTAETRGTVINLSMKPNGDRDVSRSAAPATPDETAKGEDVA